MLWRAFNSATLALLVVALPVATRKTAPQSIPCQQIHGRAAFYNGGSTLRIWQIGTKHIFWIQDDDPAAGKVEDLIKDFDHQMFADFELCPITPFVSGHMQGARVKAFDHARVTTRP